MGKLGKETKNLLLAITVICLISFLLAAGLSFLLAKDFQHEMLLHDYGVSGYQLNHEDKLQISAFTAHPNESDIERGKEALASIGYSEATEVQVGDTITLTINGKDQTVTVGGVLSDSLLARAEGTETLICSEETFSQLTGETGYTILDVQFRFGSDEEDVAEVDIWFPVIHCSHYDFPYY